MGYVMSAEEARPHLELVGCVECEKYRRQRDAAVVDLENAETDLKVSRSKIRRLQNELDEKKKNDPNYQTAERLFLFWAETTGHTRAKFDGDRIKVALRALKRYTPREIALAIKGNHLLGFTDPKTGVKYDAFGQVLRNSDTIEKNIDRWRAYCERENVRFERGPSVEELKAQEKAR